MPQTHLTQSLTRAVADVSGLTEEEARVLIAAAAAATAVVAVLRAFDALTEMFPRHSLSSR